MQILLLRHGKAEDFSTKGDFWRTLEEKGYAQAKQAAYILKTSNFLPDLVLSSPVLRAKQTAQAFTKEAGISEPILQDWLACGMNPSQAISELSAFTDYERVMICGHEPDLSNLLSYCLGTSADSMEIRKGSLACIELRPPSSSGTLRFLIPYQLAKHFP